MNSSLPFEQAAPKYSLPLPSFIIFAWQTTCLGPLVCPSEKVRMKSNCYLADEKTSYKSRMTRWHFLLHPSNLQMFFNLFFVIISAYNEEFNSLCTHQKRWFLNEVGQFSNHHVEIVFTKADDTVLDVFSALMILLGTG